MLKKLIKISRFPHFWLYSGGNLIWGAIIATGKNAFQDPYFFALLFWFIFPANVFLNAINDAFDYETDLNNPRKQSMESTVSKNGKKEMLWISFVALASVLVILPFVSVLVRELILLWIVIVIAYNVPPIRLKRYPIVDIIFGGVGQYVPMAIIGYSAASGSLPSFPLILLAIIFSTASHISSAALDVSYDHAAGIKNTTVRLGSIKNGLILSVFFYVAAAAYGAYIGFPLFSVFVLIFPALIFYNIWKGDLEGRNISIFEQFVWAPFIFGTLIGTLYYTVYFRFYFLNYNL